MPLQNLNQKLNSSEISSPQSWRIKILIVLIIILIGVVYPGISIFLGAKQAIGGGREISAALKQENFGQLKNGVTNTKFGVDKINSSLDFLIWMKIIPFVGGYYNDVKSFASAGSYELTAAQNMMVTLEPYQAEIGFTGQPSPSKDKIAQVVKILDKILPNIDQVEPYLKKASERVSSVDVNKYPEKLGNQNIRGRILEAKNFIMGAEVAITKGKDALQIAPASLGEPNAKNYLLLFQNDKEIRPTGGFITAYAFLNLDKGHLSTTASDDIYRLDEELLKVCLNKICPIAPPAPIVKYLPEMNGKPRTAWSMRDSNISPDLPISAREFERMYQMLGRGLPFDGIITIDTQVVEELIKITGPVDIFGTTYSAETDKRCNCPNVIYELEHYAEVASKGEPDRKAVLGTLMQQILAKIMAAGPEKMPTVLNSLVTLASDKHIMIYMNDPGSEAALGKLGWTGEIKQTAGDYLHINDANFAGGKSNLYVEEKVILDIKINKDGTVNNKVTIEYKNPQPFNTWLNGILRDYVRVYVPIGSKLISSKGSDDPVNTLEDQPLNKTYFDAFIQVRPQNSRVLSFEYTLPNKIQDKNYSLLIQKQPGAKDHHYIIKINGKTKAEFDLTADRELNLSF